MVIRSSPPVYIAIDPGVSGGMAWSQGTVVHTTTFGGSTPHQWRDWLKEPIYAAKDCLGVWPIFVSIERVGGYVAGNALPGSAMFNFGKNAGMIEGIVIALDLPYEHVSPQGWQKALSIPRRDPKETKGQWKGRLKERASQLFPKERVTLGVADALLILEYARRKHGGKR